MPYKPNLPNYTEQDFNFQKGKEDRIIATESFENAIAALSKLFQELFGKDFEISDQEKHHIITTALSINSQYGQYKNISFEIPPNANLEKGDFGLLPGDFKIEEWAIPTSSGIILQALVEHFDARTILEMGMSLGYSTSWLASKLKPDGKIVTTEVFEPKIAIAKKVFETLGYQKTIQIKGNIPEVIANWDSNNPIDFVFMDADKQNYHSNFQKLFPLLESGAIVVVDNVGDYPHFMQDFLLLINRMEAQNLIKSHLLEIDHGLLVIQKI
jgi:predicted O-methyltransferase YrrM